jgi:hypothetical protein
MSGEPSDDPLAEVEDRRARRDARHTGEDVSAAPLRACVTGIPAVCDIARAIAPDAVFAARLTSAPRMEPVWKWLRRRAEEMQQCPWPRQPDDKGEGELEPRLAALPERWRLHHWGLSEHDVSPPDAACAAFCACILVTLVTDNKAVTRAAVKDQTDKWRRMAEELGSERRARLPELDLINPLLAASYSMVVADLEDRADFLETTARKHPSHYLERSSGLRAVDNARAQTVAIARGAWKIFGQPCYGSTATVMSTTLALDIREGNVREWLRQHAPRG